MLGCQHSHTLSAAPPTDKEFFLPCVRVWACVLAGSHLSAYACVRTRLLGRATATASGTRTQAAFGPAPWLKSLSVLLCAARRYHTLGRHTPGRPPPSSFAAAPPCVFRYLRGEHSTPPQTSPPRTRSGPTVDQETEDRKGLPQLLQASPGQQGLEPLAAEQQHASARVAGARAGLIPISGSDADAIPARRPAPPTVDRSVAGP
jgi:hypothetical protein